jgi:dihydroorotate dehydrogenase
VDWYRALRPLLFRLDPEVGHELGMGALRAVQALPALERRLRAANRVAAPALAQRLLGFEIANPVGLAAGFDKNAVAVGGLAALGFGFAEVGTVTPEPQPGNPRPRLYRFPAESSLQNSLGFNNAGLDALRRRLAAALPYPLPIGINVGKGRATPAGAALGDYEALLEGLAPLADYLVINLSSPNTPGLRDLQNEDFVRALLRAALAIGARPVLIKLSPDLSPEAAAALAEAAVEAGAAGLVVTNTTTDYSLLAGAHPAGGLSGQVLKEKSFRTLVAVARQLRGTALLISAGGVDSGAEAYRRLRAGASLVQLYTALIYAGPGLPRRINQELAELLERDGARHVSEVIGADLG